MDAAAIATERMGVDTRNTQRSKTTFRRSASPTTSIPLSGSSDMIGHQASESGLPLIQSGDFELMFGSVFQDGPAHCVTDAVHSANETHLRIRGSGIAQHNDIVKLSDKHPLERRTIWRREFSAIKRDNTNRKRRIIDLTAALGHIDYHPINGLDGHEVCSILEEAGKLVLLHGALQIKIAEHAAHISSLAEKEAYYGRLLVYAKLGNNRQQRAIAEAVNDFVLESRVLGTSPTGRKLFDQSVRLSGSCFENLREKQALAETDPSLIDDTSYSSDPHPAEVHHAKLTSVTT